MDLARELLMHRHLAAAAFTLFMAPGAAVPAAAQSAPARSVTAADSLLVSAEWLKARRHDPDLALLAVGHHMDTTRQQYIPGSVSLDYMAFTMSVGEVRTELPPIDSLRALIEAAGISNGNRVVVYSHDPIMAARAFVTLEVVGLDRVHLLDGGAAAWKATGGAVVGAPGAARARGRFVPRPRTDIVVGADWVNGRLNDGNVALIDTRTVGEYNGTEERRGVPSLGHLPGARLLLWQELFRSREDPRLRPKAELLGMFRERGATEGKTVVTYCYIGYRASLSYFVARYLGYDAKFFDGSYNEWALKQLPLVAGERPR